METAKYVICVVLLNIVASTRTLKITTKGPLCGRGDTSPCSCQCKSKEKPDAFCGVPPSVANTDVDITTTMDESIATYTCIKDFTASGSGDIVCQADGNWSRLGLTCTKHTIICEGSSGNIACPAGQAITIVNVNYGRQQFDPCPYHDIDTDDLNCVSGSTHTAQVELACNYFNSCVLTASNAIAGDPCPGTYKYLDISYSCSL